MTIFWQRVSKCLSHVSRVAGGVTDSTSEDDEDLAAEAAGGRREGQLRHATGLAGARAGSGLRAGGSVVITKQKYFSRKKYFVIYPGTARAAAWTADTRGQRVRTCPTWRPGKTSWR